MTFIALTRRPGGLQAYEQVIPAHWPDGEPERQAHEGATSTTWSYIRVPTVKR